jgi:hypothetical protein
MDGSVRLAAARALWWHRYREHAPRSLGGYPAASATLYPVQSHFGCGMDWSRGLSLDVPHGTIFIMVYRYVRIFDATERQQAKWFVYAAVISFCLLFIGTGLPGAVPADSPSQLLFPIVILIYSTIF